MQEQSYLSLTHHLSQASDLALGKLPNGDGDQQYMPLNQLYILDTAAIYGNEKKYRQAIKESGEIREKLFITSKV